MIVNEEPIYIRKEEENKIIERQIFDGGEGCIVRARLEEHPFVGSSCFLYPPAGNPYYFENSEWVMFNEKLDICNIPLFKEYGKEFNIYDKLCKNEYALKEVTVRGDKVDKAEWKYADTEHCCDASVNDWRVIYGKYSPLTGERCNILYEVFFNVYKTSESHPPFSTGRTRRIKVAARSMDDAIKVAKKLMNICVSNREPDVVYEKAISYVKQTRPGGTYEILNQGIPEERYDEFKIDEAFGDVWERELRR